MHYRIALPCVLALAACAPALAGVSTVTPRAGGLGDGIARGFSGTPILQEREMLAFAYPTTSIGYQRAELEISNGNAGGSSGGAGLARSRPTSGVLSMSTGTRCEIVGSGQFLGDAEAQCWYDDTFLVRSDTLADGELVNLTLKIAVSTLDSSNHTATTGSLGSNNSRNDGRFTVRVRTTAPANDEYESVSTLARGRGASMAATTGLFLLDDMDNNNDTNYGEETITLQAVVGSVVTFESAIFADTESRAQFGNDGNTGFCGSLLFGLDVEDGYLISQLVPGEPVPGTAMVTRERGWLEIPPGPIWVIPAPGTLTPLAMTLLASRRRR